MRSSATNLALAYILLGLAALALFAAPLWYAWRVTIQDGRVEILQADAQRLTDVFRREGPIGLAAYITRRVEAQIAGERFLLLADEDYQPLAGNLKAWPQNAPAESGVHTFDVTVNGRTGSGVFVRVDLPGGYNLLVGRDLARFAPLEHRFWYALASAVGFLSIVGAFGGFLI
jgi:hypothetical protein